ncbi:unnamed protein product [Fusarium fujikuroi]|nr:uncharacterized protein FFE2_08917 [Fusarium fujikuroi]SCO07072.1 uncharacterized protein FFC1_10305 [Fusarium fujikuroi]SCO44733.1 uncharacterized protein FFNC_10008 [Fusarium fujikuroi]VZI03662.1 unnamed protein product [Fusarium fujikuroi]
MLGNDEQEVRPEFLAGLDQVFNAFEHSAVRARWKDEGKGVATLDQGAENVKATCRELRKSLLSSRKIQENEDRIGAIIRAEGPCTMKIKQDTHVVTIAVHGDGHAPTVGEASLPERTITRIRSGVVKIGSHTTVYMVLLGQ